MKLKIWNAVMGMSLGYGLLFGGNSRAWAQAVPSENGLEADAGRGILTERTGLLETQTTCPQRVGDAWDTTSERAWNMLEIGIQVQPADFPNPKFQLYSRYTCDTPYDRPSRR